MKVKEFVFGRCALYSAVFAVVGTMVGVGSALLRPHMEKDGTHYEAIIEFFVAMPLLCLLIILMCMRFRYRLAMLVISGQLTLLWLSALIGRTLVGLYQDPMLDDFLGMYAVFWLGSIAGAALILGLIRLIWPLRHEPTDCQNCGYSLIGIGVSGACPECGQPFSAETLGVSPEELLAEA